MKDKGTKRELIFYLLLLLMGVGVIVLISFFAGNTSNLATSSSSSAGFWDSAVANFSTFVGFVKGHILSQFGLLLLQIIVILLFARLIAWLFVKMGQPSVIGEIIAGIILGPSVFGLLYSDGFNFLFPRESLPNISLLSQFGLILFMFVIGMELDLGEIKKNLKKSFIISHSGIVIPFVLGAILAVFLYEQYAGEDSEMLPFALFIGISMSVTAFPVLARIVQERGQMQTHLGILSMASAANGDITAWCAVAIIVAIAQAGSAISALFTVLFAVLYMAFMFFVIRPAFRVVGEVYNTRETANKGIIAMIFLTLLISSYLTEILGLHALFGAFMAGVVMPDDIKFRHVLTEKVEDVSLALFLPLFFVSSGLQTEVGLLNTSTHWVITGIITLVAIIGKVGGTYVACRVVGEGKRDSLYMGILMNTRGLMELIILNMGYQLGILSPVVYAMLVIMTLFTTFMTTPSLKLVDKFWPLVREAISDAFKVLFSFGRSSTGIVMLNIIQTFFAHRKDEIEVTGMHMTVGEKAGISDARLFRATNFAPIQELADKLSIQITERYEMTENAVSSIVRASADTKSNLLLVGASLDMSNLPEDIELNKKHEDFKSRFGISFSRASAIFSIAQFFKDKTEVFVQNASSSVGVVIDRGLSSPAKTLLTIKDESNSKYSKLLDFLTQDSSTDLLIRSIDSKDLINSYPNHLSEYDLLILPYYLWKDIVQNNPEIITQIPTTLLLHSKME